MDALRVDEETGEVVGFEAVDTLDAAFEDKAEAYAVAIKSLLAQAKAIHDEMDNLKTREAAAKRRAESLKNHLAQSMACLLYTSRAARALAAFLSASL